MWVAGLALLRRCGQSIRVNSRENGSARDPSERDEESINDEVDAAEPRVPPSELAPAPAAILDLSAACCRFVKTAVGVDLDFEPETLSILDHYIDQARQAVAVRPEALAVLAHSVGAYFGEVVRRRHASWWQIDGDDPTYWQIQFESVYLAFSPVALAQEAFGTALVNDRAQTDPQDDGAWMSALELDDEDRDAIVQRLAELPPVSESEFYAPTTRLEVIDIAVEAIRARRMAADEPQPHLTPDDYEGFPLPN
jgi:hypothetical protein